MIFFFEGASKTGIIVGAVFGVFAIFGIAGIMFLKKCEYLYVLDI